MFRNAAAFGADAVLLDETCCDPLYRKALRVSVGERFAVDIVGRREGDPPALVASPDLAAGLLGWQATRGLSAMTDSAWAAWQYHRRSRT